MSSTYYQLIGDVGHGTLLVSTVVVFYCMLYRYPDISYYDETWLEYGFCVANPDSALFNSHFLAFYSDCVMSVVLAVAYHFYYLSQQQQKQAQQKQEPDLGQAFLRGSIPGVFFHGVGHMYNGIVNPKGVDLKWYNDDIPKSIVAQGILLVALFFIMKGSLSLGSMRRVALTALVATMGVNVLNVPANMNFVYISAVIYLSSAWHMLTLDRTHKQTAAYALHAYFQLPALAIGVLESTKCQEWLVHLGGHVVFDMTISVGALVAAMQGSYMENNDHNNNKVGAVKKVQ